VPEQYKHFTNRLNQEDIEEKLSNDDIRNQVEKPDNDVILNQVEKPGNGVIRNQVDKFD